MARAITQSRNPAADGPRIARAFRGPREVAFDRRPHLGHGRAQVGEHVSGDPLALDDQAQENMRSVDLAVAHAARFLERKLDHLLDARGRDDGLDEDPLVATEYGLDDLTHRGDVYAQAAQHAIGGPTLYTEKPEQQMLGADVRMMGALGLLLGQGERPFGAFREPFERVHRLSDKCAPSC